jgi:hypothetical protein
MHNPVPLQAIETASMASKDTDIIQQGLSGTFTVKNRQAFWLEDRSNYRAFPVSQWLLRCSFPLTAMAGLRWILTIFPFNDKQARFACKLHLLFSF